MSHRVTGTAWNKHVGPSVPCGRGWADNKRLVGIRGLSNPNLHIDSTIISLVFKSDYMLQLKEASAAPSWEPLQRAKGQEFGEFRRKGLVCGAYRPTNCPGGSGGTVESWAYAKHGWRCINMDCTQRNIFINNRGERNRESVHTHFIHSRLSHTRSMLLRTFYKCYNILKM